MQRSRQRDFHQTRNLNLSETYSQISHSSQINSTQLESNSTFHRETKPSVCTNCVNKKLIQNKKIVERKKKEEDINERVKIETDSKKVDPLVQIRLKAIKQSSDYNSKEIQRRIQATQSQKDLDSFFIQSYTEREKELEHFEEETLKLRKKNEEIYREELKRQYEDEIFRKKQLKLDKTKQQKFTPLITSKSFKQLRNKYALDLQKQIQNKKRLQNEEKNHNKELDQKSIEYQTQKFMEYSEFKSSKKSDNPQIFQQMKVLEQNKKRQKIQLREENQAERKALYIRNKKEAQKKALQNFKKTKSYAYDLDKQIQQKKRKSQFLKQQKLKQIEIPLTFEEQKLSMSLVVPCDECNSKVEKRELSYYS